MKVIIPGGSGQVGTLLARGFTQEGHEVVFLSRVPRSRSGGIRSVAWDGRTPGGWVSEFEGADVVINLAGRNVNCRYNAHHRSAIRESRVASTRAVGEAINCVANPPRVWLQASTATIYAHRFDAPNDDASGLLGGGEAGLPDTWRFSLEVAVAWERTLDEAVVPRTRKVKLRSAMTMSPDPGGVFDTLLRLVRFGLGGREGDGRQFVSWIHHQDFVRAVRWLIMHEELQGAVNLTSPNPVPNAEFMRVLRGAWGMPVGLPASGWLLEVGASLLRTETELILKSRRVIPRRLLESGFVFRFPEWPAAASELCREWRGRRSAFVGGSAR